MSRCVARSVLGQVLEVQEVVGALGDALDGDPGLLLVELSLTREHLAEVRALAVRGVASGADFFPLLLDTIIYAIWLKRTESCSLISQRRVDGGGSLIYIAPLCPLRLLQRSVPCRHDSYTLDPLLRIPQLHHASILF